METIDVKWGGKIYKANILKLEDDDLWHISFVAQSKKGKTFPMLFRIDGREIVKAINKGMAIELL